MNKRLGPAPDITTKDLADAIDWALIARRSMRAFLPTAVPRETITDILDAARFSASGVNTQPWHVHVLTGKVKADLSKAILAAHDLPLHEEVDEPYDYYPARWTSPYVERRRKVGWDLYGLLDIEKSDRQRMHAQHGRNYCFFDAPVGLMFTVDRAMGSGSLLDYGMFLQSIMIAAKARGLDTCPQAAFNAYHKIISRQLRIDENQMLVCGMSLGFADPGQRENTLATDREPVESFTTFHGDKA
jgi:nitroreductase